MRKKWLGITLVLGVILAVGTVQAPVVTAKETILWKDTSNQTIPNNKWTDLVLNGKTAIEHSKKSRALYCAQVHLDFTGKPKPRYVKVRFARHLSNGKLDTTGTTTWVLGKDAPDLWQGSVCWPISTKRPVSAQVKIKGSSKVWTSQLRQFKAWSPSGDLPEDVLVVVS